jgi:hypothetical protein
MAQSMRDAGSQVDNFVAMALDFIRQASEYAKSGEYDADVDGEIRKLRVAASALQTALNQVMITRPVEPPPIPEPIAVPMPPSPGPPTPPPLAPPAPDQPAQPAGRRS